MPFHCPARLVEDVENNAVLRAHNDPAQAGTTVQTPERVIVGLASYRGSLTLDRALSEQATWRSRLVA